MQPQPPRSHAIVFFIILLAVAYFSRVAPRTVINLLFLTFGYMCLRNAKFWFDKIKWPTKWECMRRVGWFRKLIRIPKLGRVFYNFSCTIACLSALASFNSFLILANVLMVPACVMLVCASFIDAGFRLKIFWGYPLGKKILTWGSVFTAAIAAFIATLIAKDVAHSVTHVNPNFFPNFIYLFAGAIYPITLLFAIGIMVFCLLCMQSICLTVGLFCATLINHLVHLLGSKADSAKYLAQRLATGDNARRRKKWGQRFGQGFEYMLRPMGTCLVVAVFVWPASIALTATPYIGKILPSLLVFVEYRPNHQCEDIPISAKLAYLDSGLVSIAKLEIDGTYQFITAPCISKIKQKNQLQS